VSIFVPPRTAAKAASGIGVSMVESGNPMLSSFDQTPQKIMRLAQLAYHRDPWIGLAESVVTRKVAGLPWHFEDDQDEEYEETSAPPLVQRVMALMEQPQAALPPPVRQPGIATRRGLVAITSRHIGLCGMAHWYADMLDGDGLPSAILYLNPAMMYPEQDKAGHVLGWKYGPDPTTRCRCRSSRC
jgi:hypothetical protein